MTRVGAFDPGAATVCDNSRQFYKLSNLLVSFQDGKIIKIIIKLAVYN